MNKQDLEKFFIRLEKLLENNGCNGRDLTNAEIILDEMNISKEEKQIFLENCRSSGQAYRSGDSDREGLAGCGRGLYHPERTRIKRRDSATPDVQPIGTTEVDPNP